MDGAYITGHDMKGFNGPGVHLHSARLLPLGRIKVKQWPSAEDAGTALLELLDEQLEATEDAGTALLELLDEQLEATDDPEEQGRIRQAIAAVRPLAGRILNEVAVGYAKRVSGLD